MLVATGFTKTTELIHLDSTPTQCILEDYPLNVFGAVGWLSEEGITICGGENSDNYNAVKDCYTLKDNQWKQWPSMTTPRAYASTIKINATQTLILGGFDGNYDLSSTEMVNSNGGVRYKDLPWTLSFSCIIKINETMGLITGGFQDGIRSETHFMNLQTLDVTSGPRMQTERSSHGCATFHFGSKTYAVVSGGWYGNRVLDSTEILDLEQSNPTWTVGKQEKNKFLRPTLGQKSSIYPKIHIFKTSFFAKFTFLNLIFRKINIFQTSNSREFLDKMFFCPSVFR